MNQQKEQNTQELYKQAALLINDCQHLLITAGAGIGVDSGLPDFRGTKGFYKAYPTFEKTGLNFYDIANPSFFFRRPHDFWWFYGHRFQAYKAAKPHDGFHILKQWFNKKDSYIYTSNVDGHFQKAGFPDSRIVECHGSINHLQCAINCDESIKKISTLPFKSDNEHLKITGHLPRCRTCGGFARPNILMFYDYDWATERSERQKIAFDTWREQIDTTKLVIIEIGAGKAIPSIRQLSHSFDAPIIRINPDSSLLAKNTRLNIHPQKSVFIAQGALDALTGIKQALEQIKTEL